MSNQDLVIPIQALYTTQHKDPAVTSKDFQHLETDELLVHGVWATLQGEGPFMGYPCVFVRLSGCNLGDKESFCQFCDTEFSMKKGKVMRFSELIHEFLEAFKKIAPGSDDKAPLMVITGGEPTLQPGLPDFIALVTSMGFMVQIETNGTQSSFVDKMLERIGAFSNMLTIVVSPKAGPKGYSNLAGNWMRLRSYLKFVVDADPVSPHSRIPDYAFAWKKNKKEVFISPMAIYAKSYDGEISDAWQDGLLNRERTRENYAYAAELCMKHAFRLSLQMHLFARIP